MKVNINIKESRVETVAVKIQPRIESVIQGPPSGQNIAREGTSSNEEKKLQEDEALRKRIREMVRESIMGTTV